MLLGIVGCLTAAADFLLAAFSFGHYSIAFIFEGLFNAAGCIIKYSWIPSVFIFLILTDIEEREKRNQNGQETLSQ